jgi:DNA-binding PadR family transcriptional regulator
LEEGTLYPALWRLQSKGLLAAEWGLSENNRKASTIASLLRADVNCTTK